MVQGRQFHQEETDVGGVVYEEHLSLSATTFADPPPQVHRGAYLGKTFMEDTQANTFFDLCQQMGGPRLLPSKTRGHQTDSSSGSKNPIASAPKSTNDIDAADADVAETEGQVCVEGAWVAMTGSDGVGKDASNRLEGIEPRARVGRKLFSTSAPRDSCEKIRADELLCCRLPISHLLKYYPRTQRQLTMRPVSCMSVEFPCSLRLRCIPLHYSRAFEQIGASSDW